MNIDNMIDSSILSKLDIYLKLLEKEINKSKNKD